MPTLSDLIAAAIKRKTGYRSGDATEGLARLMEGIRNPIPYGTGPELETAIQTRLAPNLLKPPLTGPEMAMEGVNIAGIAPPKHLYRGVAKGLQESGADGLGTFMLGKGIYSSPSKKFAQKYGEVTEVSVNDVFPRNPLVLNVRPGASAPDAFRDWLMQDKGFKSLRDFYAQYSDPGDYVRSLGYDGVFIGDEVVKYDK